MIVCGIELSGSEARLALLEGTKASFVLCEVTPRKLALANHEDQQEVAAFRDSIHAFLRENGVELIAIKKRNTRGEFAGGPVGFKVEGIVQLFGGCPVSLLASATIAAAQRNCTPTPPTALKQYQQTAFAVAFAALPKA